MHTSACVLLSVVWSRSQAEDDSVSEVHVQVFTCSSKTLLKQDFHQVNGQGSHGCCMCACSCGAQTVSNLVIVDHRPGQTMTDVSVLLLRQVSKMFMK